jgi:hypothetical protein
VLVKLTPRTAHGFDSFEGLPGDWAGTKEAKGAFSLRGRLPKEPGNARLHVGWFDRTLPDFLAADGQACALIHACAQVPSPRSTANSIMACISIPISDHCGDPERRSSEKNKAAGAPKKR